MSIDITSLQVIVKSDGIREASNSLGGLSTSAVNSERRITSFIAAMEKLNAISRVSSQGMDSFMLKIREQAALMQSMNTNSRGAATGTAALASAIALLSTSLNLLNQNSLRAAQGQRGHNDAMREGHALARGLSGSLGALWVTYGAFTGMAVGLAIGASLKGIVTVGKDVEHTLESIRVLGEATTKEIDSMREAIMELGKGAFAPKDVAMALSTLTLAGLNASDAMKGVGASLDLALVGGVSVEKASYTLVQVGTALGYTADGFGRIADVIAKTAAASMSSVESISGAFKSAASVGELYGATLVDIGVGLAAIANLGIQGTAAGTALKNMYKDLASQAEKVTSTYKDMLMSIKDLRDANGDFIPLIDVVKRLDVGLSNLKGTAVKDALGKIFGERGVKEGTALLKMLHTASTELDAFGVKYATKLDEVNDKINKSYAFATLGAIAMAQTTQSQLKTVVNTLQTKFLEAFKEVSPQMSEITRSLKAAFNSPEFITGLKDLAVGVANLTKMLIENLDIIVQLAKAYIAFKIVTFAAGLLTLARNFSIAGVAARGFVASLGPIGLAIAALTTAWILYTEWKDKALNNKPAAANLKDYTSDVLVAAKKEEELLALRKKGFSEAQILQQQEDKANKAASEKAVGDSRVKLTAMEKARDAEYALLTNSEKRILATAMSGDKAGTAAKALSVTSESVNAYITTQNNYTKALAEHTAQVDLNKAATDRLLTARKANAEISDAEAKAGRFKSKGTGELSGKADTQGINDAYAAAQEAINGRIKESKKALQAFEEASLAQFKAGQIGKLQFIEMTGKKEIALQEKMAAEYLAQENLAKKSGNKADVERYSNLNEQALKAAAQAELRIANDTKVQLEKYDVQRTAFKIKELEAQGLFAKAADLKFSSEHSTALKQMESDIKAYGSKYPELIENQTALNSLRNQMVNDGKVKEATAEFERLNAEMTNLFKGVKTASEGEGIAAMWNAATAASEAYRAKLPELEAAQKKLADLATTPEQKTIAQESITKIKAQAEHQKTMWASVGESIGKSLEKAFGKGGKALGEMIKISSVYSNQSDKSGEAQVNMYGNMASAAKGFFKENTTGYKTIQGLEQAMQLAKLTNMAEELYMSLFVTQAKTAAAVTGMDIEFNMLVATEAAGNAVKAPGVFMSFMSALGPWGAAAAAVAIAAVLGGAFSGGGSINVSAQRQASQGTGSVLGDDSAKSESIANSLDILEKESGLGLVHSQAMVNSLKAIESGIGNFAANVLQSTGVTSGKFAGVTESKSGFLASLFGGSSTSITDTGIRGPDKGAVSLGDIRTEGFDAQQYVDTKTTSWWGGDKDRTSGKSLGDATNSQLKMIIVGLANSVSEGARSLGLSGAEFTDNLNAFQVDIGHISAKGLSGSDFEKAVEAVFSKLGDEMVGFSILGVSSFQQIGEGLFETLSRLTNNFTQVKDVLAVLGKDFNVSGMAAVRLSESLIVAAGGLDKLTEGTQFFVENFLTKAEQMTPIINSVHEEMSRLGVSSVTTLEQFKQLVLSQNLSTQAGQEMYGALLNVAPAFKTAADYAIELATGIVELTDAEQRLLDIALKQRELDIQLMEAQGNAAGALAATRYDELAALTKLSPALAVTQQAIYDAVDATEALANAATAMQANIDKLKKVATQDFAVLSKSITEAKAVSKSALDAQTAIITAQKTAATEAYNNTKTAINATLSTAKEANTAIASLASSLQSTLDSMTLSGQEMSDRSSAQSLILAALATARSTGVLPTAASLANALKTVSSPSEVLFATFEDYARDFGLTKNSITDLNILTAKSKSISDLQLEALSASLVVLEDSYKTQTEGFTAAQTAAQAAYDADISRYDSMLNLAQAQLDVMNGTQVAVKSMADAMLSFVASSRAATVAVAASPAAVAAQATPTQGATKSQIESIYTTQLGRQADVPGLAYWVNEAANGSSISEINSRIVAIINEMPSSPEYAYMHGSHADGLDNVPFDNYRANLHAGERVLTAKAARDADNTAEELRQMRVEMQAQNLAIIRNTDRTAKILERFDGDGMPAERTLV